MCPSPSFELPERYARALGDDDPLESQRKAPKRVGKLLKGLSEKQLSRRPAPDRWSIKEVVAHLADGEFVNGARMRFVVAHDRPALAGYDQDRFVASLGAGHARTRDLLEAFAGARAINVAMLRRLPEEAFARVGLHSERGEESLAKMVALYAAHDRIHERQIEAVREALRAAKAQKKRDRKAGKPARKARRGEPGARTPKPEPRAERPAKEGRAPKPDARGTALAGSAT